jgi:hypothetical protein
MDATTLETLKNQYPTSSWALWSSNFPKEGCVEEDASALYEFIEQNRGQLRPSVVLLSLNPSTKLPSNYLNFHSTDPKHRNDQFRDLVEEAGLEGAYMTDLVERIVDPNSGNVNPTDADVKNLFRQLDLLNQERYHILCFHEKVFQTLLDFCDSDVRELQHDIQAFRSVVNDTRIECYRVWFHANWGANRDKIPALQNQLSYLKSEVIDTGLADLSDWMDN